MDKIYIIFWTQGGIQGQWQQQLVMVLKKLEDVKELIKRKGEGCAFSGDWKI